MSRWVLALVVAALGRGTAGAEDPATEEIAAAKAAEVQRVALAALAAKAKPSILSVQVRGLDGNVVRRNAVIVDASGWIVMAGPTPGPRDTVVVLHDRDATPVVPVASDPETALTLLQMLAPPPNLQAVILPTLDPRRPLPAPPLPGAAVVMVASDGAVARGNVRAVDRWRSVPDRLHGGKLTVSGLLEASLATIASDLGAPWFDAEGRLVGLLVGGLLEEQAALSPGNPMRPEPVAAHAVPAAVVSLVWPLLRIERGVRRARLGVQARPPSEALLSQLCPSCGGHELEVVDPDGPAARAGLEVHDVIVAVEGAKLRPHVSLSDTLLPFRPLDPITFTVLRRGKRSEVKVILGGR